MSDVPANTNTTAQLSIGQTITGEIDFAGDRDWVRMELAAGEWVQVTQRGIGSDGIEDSYLRVYDANGALITGDDELSASNANFDAAVTFGGNTAGTYYVAAGGYRDNHSGDYSLSARAVAAPSGNPADALDSGSRRTDSAVSVYFVQSGERAAFGQTTSTGQDDIVSEGWNTYEKSRALAALNSIAAVTDLTFTVTNDPNADFQLVLDTNELNNNGLLGYFYLPSGTRPSVGVFNGNGIGWDDASGGGLDAGGLGYATLVHEFLHGLGLAHPHDSDQPISGVHTSFRDYGVSGLNQGIYTTMSYNGGYQTTPSSSYKRGNEAGPMALDIAALQALYGANNSFASGNNIYELPETGATAWQAIWDTGGSDTIRYSGSLDSTIDLRAATLTYEIGGGGFVSSAAGVTGGYTIANGVTIENAVGGSGADALIGNTANNILQGGAGHDTLVGGGGNDTLDGGADNDAITGNTGDDLIMGGAGNDTATGGAGDDDILGGTGDDSLSGNAGADEIAVESGTNTLRGNSGRDLLNGGTGIDTIDGGSGNDVITGGGGNDKLIGGRGADDINGGDGDDRIDGGWGADRLTGALGADTFVFSFLSDSSSIARDQVTDFETGQDLIDLHLIDANSDIAGDQAFVFIGSLEFFAKSQLRLTTDGADTIVQADRDGDGVADLEILLSDAIGLSGADFIL